MAVAQASISASGVYYTDGSVDPARGTTGTAAVTGGEVLSWRTPDHYFTLQTELVAIKLALVHIRHRREVAVVIHTDSKSSLEVLQQPNPTVDVRIMTSILAQAQTLPWRVATCDSTGCPATRVCKRRRRPTRQPGLPPPCQ